MAERRMFSKKIIYTAKFLKMPISTQNLYFHLGLNADDDGIVEAYTVMNQIGATEDDLKILVTKQYVVVLNNDLVTYITDWRENNKLRADRKVDSLYKDLLLQVLPDTNLLESKTRADVENNGHTMDVQRTHNGPNRIGKGSIGKYSIGKDKKYFESENLNSAFLDWLEYKKQRKDKYTEIGLTKLITQINNQLKNHSEDEIINLINNCIASSYQGIVFEKLPNVPKKELDSKNNEIPDWVYKMGGKNETE